MKEQIFALHAKVIRSTEVERQTITAASALTISLPTIALHPTATVPPPELVISTFSVGILLMTGASTAPVWELIPPAPQAAYPLTYPYPLPPTHILLPEPRHFKSQTIQEWTNWKRAYEDQF